MKRLVQAASSICAMLLITAISSTIGGAKADEASDYLAAAGDEVKAYADCTTDFARPLLTSSRAPEDIAADADKACEAKLGAMTIALEGPPTNLAPDKAAQVTSDVAAGMRRHLIGLIEKARD